MRQWERYGAYSAPNPEPGSSTLDPIAERTNFSNSNFPLKSRERVDSHGLGGICRPPDAMHPGKQKKNGNGENLFSPMPFFCFHSARGDALSFPYASCGKKSVKPFTPIANRSPEEELLWCRGTGAAEAPASSFRLGPCQPGKIAV